MSLGVTFPAPSGHSEELGMAASSSKAPSVQLVPPLFCPPVPQHPRTLSQLSSMGICSETHVTCLLMCEPLRISQLEQWVRNYSGPIDTKKQRGKTREQAYRRCSKSRGTEQSGGDSSGKAGRRGYGERRRTASGGPFESEGEVRCLCGREGGGSQALLSLHFLH